MELRFQHSPAPWRADAGEHNYLIRDAFGDSLGALARRTGDHPADEQAANARLICAAPALLAAAVDLVGLVLKPLGDGLADTDVIAAAYVERFTALQAAIALATTPEGAP